MMPIALTLRLPTLTLEPAPPKLLAHTSVPVASKRAIASALVPVLWSGPPPKSIVPEYATAATIEPSRPTRKLADFTAAVGSASSLFERHPPPQLKRASATPPPAGTVSEPHPRFVVAVSGLKSARLLSAVGQTKSFGVSRLVTFCADAPRFVPLSS